MQVTLPNGHQGLIGLTCKANEYNCSVKMVGRLLATARDLVDNKDVFVNSELDQLFMSNKDQIIKEFADWCMQKTSWTALRDQNKIFPSDTGTYLPNFLLYADSVSYKNTHRYYESFKGFIREIEDNPNHGFMVFQLPLYSNNTYGGNVWPSRVWGIVPPGMVERLYLPNNNKSQASKISQYIENYGDGLSKKDVIELKSSIR